ncbi:methyl-accepting chemotaxis sensory transducer with Cache sensor [Paucimonas lemoignei]|uniref:Methyl-accepting chemotaxis sensory transducer with Cache sensor n=1 Tax=Paucimonas lemoignei TaxID=29443 RepID=A0A4R3HZL1_PAULE|nr:methyl-accepting chemotaxis protein [Paucimonas lemoignei]TCS38334.1 methyl-accepting chemotaxis sensory transducer with Cache sensor [Paucimonas lemoignei]
MEKLFSLSIAKKLYLIFAWATLSIGILTSYALLSEKDMLLDERKTSVQRAVESAHGVLQYYHEQASKGAMPEEEAKRQAIAQIKRLRYSGTEYFWINDMHPRMVMHPIKPELDGKDLSDNKDPNGKRLFVEFVETVKAKGSGFVMYEWPKPGQSAPVPKASYVSGFAPWGWVIGSGVYIDTVTAAFWERLVRFALVALALCGVLIFVCSRIARSITRPLHQALNVAKTVAAGDLTSSIRVKGSDETAQLLHALAHMNDSLSRIVAGVRTGTDAIASASNQIASGNMDLSSRTEAQASSLAETTSSLEQLTSTVKQNADNARQANGLATAASEVAMKGGTVVAEVVETMGSINGSSKKIVDIISVIDGIAFQTNILALNAAVEAARAGEQGRGFAVVATEVRTLAQRSAAAAREIKELIGDSVEKVEAGTKLVDQAGVTMQEIVTSIRRVTDIMGEISAASQEQTTGIEQINQAITKMDEATQQNSALVEQSAAAAQSMQHQAANLASAVSVFKLSTQAPRHASLAIAPASKQVIAPPATAVSKPGGRPTAKPTQRAEPALSTRPAVAASSAARGDDWEEF